MPKAIILQVALNLFICQTPFHVLASEAILNQKASHFPSDSTQEHSYHLVYLGRGNVDQLDFAGWTTTHLFVRPKKFDVATRLKGAARLLSASAEDMRNLVAATAAIRRLIGSAPGAVNVHVPHFEGVLANDIGNRYATSDKVTIRGFPDGLLDIFPLERIRISPADYFKAGLLRAIGLNYRPRLGPIGGANHELFDHYYTFFPAVDSSRLGGAPTTPISLEFLLDRTGSTAATRHVLLLGQEPVIAAWGEERYLAWVERAATYLRERYQGLSFLYKPHHSGPYVHHNRNLPFPVLDDDAPVERILGKYNVAAVASLASTGLVTAKLILGEDVDAISLNSRPGAMSSNPSFRRRPEALSEAFRMLGVEEVRFTP